MNEPSKEGLPNFDINFFSSEPSRKRFASLTDEELNKLLDEKHSKKTKTTTNWGISTFKGRQIINFLSLMCQEWLKF